MKIKKRNAEAIRLIPQDDGRVQVWHDDGVQGNLIGVTRMWPSLHDVMKVATS